MYWDWSFLKLKKIRLDFMELILTVHPMVEVELKNRNHEINNHSVSRTPFFSLQYGSLSNPSD